MTARIDQYALFFAEIDRGCSEPREVTQFRLFELFGADGLRRRFQAVSFLCERLGLEWNAVTLEDLVEKRRIQVQAQVWCGQPWGADLQRYLEALTKPKARLLKAKTLRGYQTAAGGLMTSAGVSAVGSLTQAHVDQYLKRNPGQSANLAPFVRYLRENQGTTLTIKKKPNTPPHEKDKALVQRVLRLTRRLEEETDGGAARALLVALVSSIHQVPVKEVLALTSAEVTLDQGTVVVWPDGRNLRLDGRLGELFKRWAPALMERGGGVLLFPGRNGLQPLSYGAVRFHAQ